MRLKYYQLAQSNWDPFTIPQNPTIRSEVSALGTYSPFFDAHLAWFPNAMAYFDSYAIYTSATAKFRLNGRKANYHHVSNHHLVTAHPEWIAKDANGNFLFIPWGCSNGTCPQYCGDISNPQFVQHQVDSAVALAVKGYAGIWVDDVNLLIRACDGNGNAAIPIDSQTGKPMVQHIWATYFTQYMKQMRRSLPPYCKVTHNSIWNAPGASGEIAAADYIWIERGFSDGGITGGTGPYSLYSLFKFIDFLHWQGASAVIGEYFKADMEYATACYFLANNGGDMISFDDQLPDASWPTALFHTDLSSPLSARSNVNGLWRRDFTGGIALVNEPSAPAVTVPLPQKMTDYTGASFTQVTLQPKHGKILLF